MKVGPRSGVSAPAPEVPVAKTEAPATSGPVAAPVGWKPTNVARAAEVSAAKAAPSPAETVRAFYDAFEKHDAAAMGALYANDVKFQDAIFQFDDKQGVTKMWTNLFKTDPNAKLKFTVDSSSGDTVKGHWVADYHVLGRPVHNEVSTQLKVKDGKIVEHHDDFSWKKWAPQAFPAGKLFTLPGLDSLAKAVVRSVLG